MTYDFKIIEKKWQKKWEEKKVFEVREDAKKKKFYVLEMFPYPSGSGLHMGHAWNYTIGDILARFKIMQGFNVLHPMGYDALGLPAENAAIKDKTHPEEYTKKSIKNYIKQQKNLGLSYDWSRMINTADSEYYKWDQWIFLKMFEKGLAYKKTASVNWCPSCATVLANEQAQTGFCERCETKVEIKHLKQWFLKITDYADRLLEGHKKLNWPERTIAMQKNWIGKSFGTEIDFEIAGKKWPIFTTRPDTIYGVTFMVVSAQHPKLFDLVTKEQKKEVEKFLKKLKSVSEKELAEMDKQGVFTGSYAINPVTKEKIPVWAGNFVVADYGCGMVMAVPAHDQRDFEFAKKYGIEVKQVVCDELTESAIDELKYLKKLNLPIIIGGGFASDIHLGKIMRNHEDLDIFIDENKINLLIENYKKKGFKITRWEDDADTQMPNVIWKGGYYAQKKVNGRVILEVEIHPLKIEKNNVSIDFGTIKQQLGNLNEITIKKNFLEIRDLLIFSENGLTKIKSAFYKLYNREKDLSKLQCFTNYGKLINSQEFSGLSSEKAKEEITKFLEKKKLGRKKIQFKLRDWLISRQRYWGTPIPIVHCEKCGVVPVPEKELPVELPKKVKFGEGNPLETNEKWIKTKCPKCKGDARRETDTMDTFVNSSWYFLRYCDPHNDKKIFDEKKTKYWVPVDCYIGGAEHACMHLIYARFYTMFLHDLGLIDFEEFAPRLFHQGMLHAEGGEKMSKSKGNIVLPESVSEKYGIDTARFFLSSLASPDKDIDWEEKGIQGSLRFVNRIIYYFDKVKFGKSSNEVEVLLNRTLKNVGDYFENFEYRKATIEIRALFDEIEKEQVSKDTLGKFLQMLSPFCPHITEELWEKLGNKNFISLSKWPSVDESKLKVHKKEIDLHAKIVEQVQGILSKVSAKSRSGSPQALNSGRKVYLYVMPFEIAKLDKKKIAKELGKDVEIYSTSDAKKHDPKGMSRKARPGLAGVWVE